MSDIDLTRALSFGAAAEQYDRARPSYPAALIDGLVALRPRAVLDVGAGTGKAAELLVARGLDVLAVEPDARMATIARRKGIAVEDGAFQSWDARGRRFDLITAGQSWHWMPQPDGARQAFAVLRPSGHLAAFWNLDIPDERSRTVLDPVYRTLAPDIAADNISAPSAARLREHAKYLDPIAAAGFQPIEVRTYAWSRRYSTEAWIDVVATHSDHATLPELQRQELLDAVADTIKQNGGTVTCDFTTILILATRGESSRAPDVP